MLTLAAAFLLLWFGIRWINNARMNMVCRSTMDWSGNPAETERECERLGIRRPIRRPRYNARDLHEMFEMEPVHMMERGMLPKVPMLEPPREPSAPAREAREARDTRGEDSTAPRRTSFTPYMG